MNVLPRVSNVTLTVLVSRLGGLVKNRDAVSGTEVARACVNVIS
jgi:hypothetical protein